MKRSLRKQVSVFLAGAMTFTTVLAQTSVFAEDTDTLDEVQEVTEAELAVDDVVISSGAVTSSNDEEGGITADAVVTESAPVIALEDAVTTSTGFQVLVSSDAKAKEGWAVGDTFSADLKFNDINNVGINNFTVCLEYNSDVVELDTVTDGDVQYVVDGVTYKLLSAGRVKTQDGIATTTSGIKHVTLAAVAGLPDNGSDITAADKNYKAEGSTLATLNFKVKSMGKAAFAITSVSDAATLNTLDVKGDIVNVPVTADQLVGDSILFAAPVAPTAKANYTVSPAGYDLTIKSTEGVIDVTGALTSGFTTTATDMYEVTLKDDADVDGLTEAIKVAAPTNTTIKDVGSNGISVVYNDGTVNTTSTFTFKATNTVVNYTATSTDLITVAKAADVVTVTGDKVKSYADGTVKLVNDLDVAKVAANVATALSKQDFVTATSTNGVVTVTFLKAANYNGVNKTLEVKDTTTLTFVSDVTPPTPTAVTSKFTLTGTQTEDSGKATNVVMTLENGAITTTVNGIAVTFAQLADGTVVIPTNCNFAKAGVSGDNSADVTAVAANGTSTVKINGTAYKVQFVRFGDVDKNGAVAAADYAQIKAAVKKTITLGDVEAKLADVDANGSPAAADYAQVKAKVRGALSTAFKAETNALGQ